MVANRKEQGRRRERETKRERAYCKKETGKLRVYILAEGLFTLDRCLQRNLKEIFDSIRSIYSLSGSIEELI